MAVKVGVVGIGAFGVTHLRTFRQLEYTGQAKLVTAACTGKNIERMRQREEEFGIKIYTNYKEMLEKEDIDAVTVVTPDFAHREIAVNAAKAGKHILVEKPLDVTIEGCQDIIDAAEEAGVLLQVDFHKRYDPYHKEMEHIVQSGKMGKIQYGYVHMEDRIEVPRDWFPHWVPYSSPAWFLGVHFYDLVRWIMRSNAIKVYATGVKDKLVSLGIDTFDSIQAKVDFENGASVTFDSSWILPEGFEAIVNQGIRLVGSEGVIEVDSQDRGARSCITAEGMKTYNLGFMRREEDKHSRVIDRGYGSESIADFIENILFLQNGGSREQLAGKYPSGEDGLEVTKIAVAVHRSIETGEVVRL